jgi:hypothetical protein
MAEDDVRSRLEAVEQELRALRGRLDRLEAGAGLGQVRAAGSPAADRRESGVGDAAAPAAPARAAAGLEGAGPLAVAGRVLLVMAGAYLVRTLADAGVLSLQAGAALGLGYALAWMALAHRAAAAGRRPMAVVHGLTTGLIAYPLLWETSARFKALPAPLGFLLVTLVMAVALLTASRHGLSAVAWGHAGLAATSTLALLAVSHDLGTGTAALLAQAAVVETVAHGRAWPGPRILAATAANAGTLVLVWLAGRPQGLPEGYPALSTAPAVALALALPALYLLSMAARTLREGRSATAFDVLQFAAGVAIGFRGAERILLARGAPTAALGAAALALGLLGYTVAFAFVERRRGHDVNFYFYSTAGGLLTLLGSLELLGAGGRSLVCATAAFAAAWLGERFGRTTLRFHAAAYLVVGGAVSALFRVAWDGLFGSPRLPSPAGLAVGASAVLCYLVLARGAIPAAWGVAPRVAVGLAAVWSLAGLAVGGAATAAGATPTLRAALGTALLAASAVALAAAARRWRLIELPWLSYGVLAVGAAKLLVQDYPLGRPGELAAALLLYGAALLLAPRLLRGR